MATLRVGTGLTFNGVTGDVNFLGIVTAVSFTGNVTGNITGNVTGNVTGTASTATLATNAQGLTGTPNITVGNVNATGVSTFSGGIQVGVTTSITVGDTFIKRGAVGLGTTNTTGRDAGVGTAAGTLIYNVDSGLQMYDTFGGWITVKSNVTASGGTVDTSSRGGYKVHTFTGSADPFVVTGGTLSNTEVLVVAGGGGGSTGTGSGGAGAGGLLYSSSVSFSSGSYTIQIGAGGAAAAGSNQVAGTGTPSYIIGPSVAGFTSITALGGGYGAVNGTSPGGNGGSGGGAAGATINSSDRPNGTATQNPSGGLTGYGNPGGTTTGGPSYIGSGGGGAGAVGGPGTSPTGGGAGGNGLPYSITGVTTHYAGGGGGGMEPSFPASIGLGGLGGGGNGGSANASRVQTAGSPGSGGGAGGTGGNQTPFKSGGSGIVIIAYPN